jgi:hypothetical protein
MGRLFGGPTMPKLPNSARSEGRARAVSDVLVFGNFQFSVRKETPLLLPPCCRAAVNSVAAVAAMEAVVASGGSGTADGAPPPYLR